MQIVSEQQTKNLKGILTLIYMGGGGGQICPQAVFFAAAQNSLQYNSGFSTVREFWYLFWNFFKY